MILLTFGASAAVTEYGKDEVSEAISIMEECDGKPGQNELERLYELGFTDEDIEGFAIFNSLRKDKTDVTPYIVIIVTAVCLSAAVVSAAALCRSKK